LVQGFLAVRQHSEKFLALTELMLYSGFPCFKPQSVLNLENRFRRDLSDYDAAVHMKKIVKFAAANWRTKAYDYFQYKTNKIVF
jgi:phosphatidylinositol 4-kinase